MKELESALSYIDNEINTHTEKLIELKKKLKELTPMAHDLSIEYATSELNEQTKLVGYKSVEVGNKIAELEREINKVNQYIESLWNSKMNLNQIIDNESNKDEGKAR